MQTYVMEDVASASYLSLERRDDQLEGTIVETTFSGGLPFEATGYVGGYIRDGRLSIIVVSDPGSPEFLFASEGTLEDDRVVLTRGGVDGTYGSVVYRPGSQDDYRRAIARIAARAAASNS